MISPNSKNVESTNKNLPSVKPQGPNGFNSELFQTLKKQSQSQRSKNPYEHRYTNFEQNTSIFKFQQYLFKNHKVTFKKYKGGLTFENQSI